MKMSERIQRNMQSDGATTVVSLQLPEHVAADLEEVASAFGFSDRHSLIRSYISSGLRDHLADIEAQRANEVTVEEFTRRLVAHGLPEKTVQEVAAEMRAQR